MNGKKRKSDFLFDVCPLFTQRNKQGWKQSYADETEFEMRNFHIFLCPCHEMAGAYSVTSFCHSVLLSLRHHSSSIIISTTFAHIQLKFYIWIYFMTKRLTFNLVPIRWILRNMPPKLWKQMEIHSLILISTITHIQLKFVIWMCLTNTQFEFEFAFGLMTFDRDVPLELWKKWVCVCSLTFEGMHIHV